MDESMRLGGGNVSKRVSQLSQLNVMMKLKEKQYMSKRSLNYSQVP